MDRRPRIVLASASPRRLELLETLGLTVEARPSRLAESRTDGEPPAELVVRLARDKGRHVARGIAAADPPTVVLAADTEVVLAGEVLGKPRGPEDAARMLGLLAGREHEVLTAVWACRSDDRRHVTVVERTRVRFRDYDERLIRWYVGSGEPLDKAGAYGIQGRGVLLVQSIAGSWSNVVGLPLERLPELLEAIGLSLLDLLEDAAERGAGATHPRR